jgi:diguanylate cyclase (GGDEF)-like protein
MSEPCADIDVPSAVRPADQTPAAPPSRPRPAIPIGLIILTSCVACAGLIWFLGASGAVGGSPLQLAYRAALALAGLLVLGALAVASWRALRCERAAGSDLRRLLEMLPLARAGEIPIDELKSIGGALAPLSNQFQEMLHELRQQRAALAALEAELPQRVANRTSALERTIGSLRQQAIRDPMTGLYNRRLLDQHLPPIIDRCRAAKSNLSLLMIDVDHFKKLNDTLGHIAGDEMLRDIAQIIRSTIRENDAAFRYGGDEFVVVLEGFDAEAGQALGDRLISLVDALAQTLRVSPKPRLSIGVATIKDLAKANATAFLKEADRLLYEEKRGRRRTSDVSPPERVAV